MASLSIRGLDESVRDKLRQRAAARGHSMGAGVREILRAAVENDGEPNVVTALVARFRELGGVDLDIPPRDDFGRELDLD